MTIANTAKVKNTTIAEYAHIQVSLLSALLTTMLIFDAIAITLSVATLNSEPLEIRKHLNALFAFSCATGIVLFFLTARYIENVTYRFSCIEKSHMDAIANIAKRFFIPFLICLASNIFLACISGLLFFLNVDL